MVKPDYIAKIDPIKAQAIVDGWPNAAWQALELGFGKDKVYVIIHGKGPTDHIHAIEKLLRVNEK